MQENVLSNVLERQAGAKPRQTLEITLEISAFFLGAKGRCEALRDISDYQVFVSK